MTEPHGPGESGDVPLTVLGVRVELPAQQHVVLLLDPPGDTVVPLWVGAPEAAAAALALEGLPTPRPLTHAHSCWTPSVPSAAGSTRCA